MKVDLLELSDTELVKHFAKSVKNIARKYNVGTYTTHDLEDLISVGVEGLLIARKRFDKDRGIFAAYAYRTIDGFISDFTRKETNSTRAGRGHRRTIKAARDSLTAELGRPPTSLELASFMNIDIAEFRSLELQAQGRSYYSVDDDSAVQNSSGIEGSQNFLEASISMKAFEQGEEKNSSQTAQLIGLLRKEIEQMPPKEREILSLCYCYELPLKDVSKIMGISESRASQVKSIATKMLMDAMSKHL